MRFGIFLGLIVGAIAAFILRAEEPEPDDQSPLAAVKRQAHAAVEAGKEEAAETEAEIMRQYEEARHGKR
jgi:hypothetical protein